MSIDFLQLVAAITLAFILSHVSMLVLLGRHEELYASIDNLTGLIARPAPADPAFCPYPCALPAGEPGWGAPISMPFM